MVPFERAMVLSYRLSVVTIELCLTIRPQFVIERLRHSNQQGWVTLEQNLERKGLTDVSQILTRSAKDMGCHLEKKSCRYLLPFEHNART